MQPPASTSAESMAVRALCEPLVQAVADRVVDALRPPVAQTAGRSACLATEEQVAKALNVSPASIDRYVADVDRETFALCAVPRAKTGRPQILEIPRALAPYLRAWWERAGKPSSGPVFPSRRGKRAGAFRSPRGQSFASRLRRELFRARIHRRPPIEVPATKAGVRTDLGGRAEGTQLAPNPHDELYFEQALR